MHEMSLAEAVIGLVEESAAKEHFNAVKTIWLEIGQLSHVEPDALRFCFEAVSEQTVAEGAMLEIIKVPGAGYCADCMKEVEINQLYEPCPLCHGFNVTPVSGSEMRVKELEVM